MRINGIIETAPHVADPTVTAAFCRRLFGFTSLLESERLVALDVAGKNVRLLFRAGTTEEPFDTGGGNVCKVQTYTNADLKRCVEAMSIRVLLPDRMLTMPVLAL